jgi:uncharacterized protein YxjI
MTTTPANWYPDPSQRHELRYWDGAAWTEHVSDRGVTSLDDPNGPATPGALSAAAPTTPTVVYGTETAQKIQEQVGGTGMRSAGIQSAGVGGGTMFTEPVLVVNQKAKLIEITNQYAVFNGAGVQVGSVSQVGQSAGRKVLRALTNVDQFLTHKLEVTDMGGAVLMKLTRPAKVFKSTVVVSTPTDQEIGRIVQENMIGKIHFGLESNGQTIGAIKAENWRAWNFRIDDASGTEVARITKTFEGIAKTLFTTADNYVVQIHTELPEPLRSLVIAAALSVDTALKQDSK